MKRGGLKRKRIGRMARKEFPELRYARAPEWWGWPKKMYIPRKDSSNGRGWMFIRKK